MDFSSLKERLERLHASIGARFTNDVESATKIEENIANGRREFKFTFGNDTNAEAQNKIMIIFYNLHTFKDNLKNLMETKGQDKNLIETEVNNSSYLQLIFDLTNEDKHEYPLTKTNRTKRNPLIKNIRSELRSTTKPEENAMAGFSIDLRTGKTEFFGENKIVITADITDGNGNYILSLDELLEGATNDWGKVIQKYSLNSFPGPDHKSAPAKDELS